MIIVEITNGLGNQLFQYATARALAIRKKAELYIDKTWYNNQKTNNRTFELDKFNINYKLAKTSHIKRLKSPKFPFLINSFYWRYQYKISYYKRDFFKEQSFLFDSNIFKTKNNVFLSGYFQSEKYFKDIREILIEEIDIKGGLNDRDKTFLNQIQNSNSVCLSIRRGDYLKTENRTSFNIIEIDYYLEAINFINSKVDNPKYFIFTDDLEWLNKNISLFQLPNFTLVGSHENYPQNGLVLMKHCKHFIMANSTFSWWGAWLSKESDKLIITPKKWFVTEKLQTKDLLPYEWIKM